MRASGWRNGVRGVLAATCWLFISWVAMVACSPASETRATAAADPILTDPAITDSANPPDIGELAFSSAGQRLNGLIYMANGAGPHPTVVLLHGFPGTEKNLDLAQAIRRTGSNVLYFDYRGLWGSGGTFTWDNSLKDVSSALAYARNADTARKYRIDPKRLAVVGHSLGGWLAVLSAKADPGVKCVGLVEVANMGAYGRRMRTDTAWSRPWRDYMKWLTGPGGPVHADPIELTESMTRNADAYDLINSIGSLADRHVLLVDMTANASHGDLVKALQGAGARDLKILLWKTDHSFNDRRIALIHEVSGWLGSACTP